MLIGKTPQYNQRGSQVDGFVIQALKEDGSCQHHGQKSFKRGLAVGSGSSPKDRGTRCSTKIAALWDPQTPELTNNPS